MRHLLQPRVLNQAIIAALASAVACYPRFALWLHHPEPVWYLEGMVFLCGIVLWGFVFAWHTPCAGRPVFVFNIEPKMLAIVTIAGIAAAAAFHHWLDPSLRSKFPEEYPSNLSDWLAQLLFSLFLGQLFLLFAPFAWLMRLVGNREVAASLTVLFQLGVYGLKIHSLATPFPPLLLLWVLAGRIVLGFLAVWFYLRGGVFLIWWWAFLLQAGHFPDSPGNS